MTPERWQIIDRLLDEIREIPLHERENFLTEKCGADNDLKDEVISLLKAEEKADEFIEDSAFRIVAKNLGKENRLPSNLQGKTVGSYKIKKLIGEGGMGEVFLAFDKKLKREVAVKILPGTYEPNDERVSRFEREASAISALNHPNIVTIYDVGVHENINYIATEYVEGDNLRISVRNGMNLKGVLNVVIQCCDALAAAHNAGVIHRDIKPENIIVRPDGYVKILDFGLAKLTGNSSTVSSELGKTVEGMIIGTPAYMSPEQISADKVDHRTDLWSIGLVLYELITGINPFKKETKQRTFEAIISKSPPLASSLNDEIPVELDQILLKALEKDADISYQSAADLRADLKRIKREMESSPSNSNLSERLFFTSRNRWSPIYSGLFSIIAVTVLVGSFVWWFSSGKAAGAENEWSNAKNSQLTSTSGIAQYPSLSPDGKTVVYSAHHGGKQDIFWQRVGGKTTVNLTDKSNGHNSMPAFSPDGKLIAFRSDRQPSGIYLMEETGENIRRLSDIGYHPSWSPDGRKIVVSDSHSGIHKVHTVPQSSLWVIDVESGEKVKLETNGDAIFPSWSPNGHRIAFWYVEMGKPGEIATIPADGGEPLNVTQDPANDWNPVWSPDGKYLYFCSDPQGSMSIWRVAIEEKTGSLLGEKELVSALSRYSRHLAFSRNGEQLAFVRYESQSNLLSLDFDSDAGKVIGEPKWITRENQEISFPDLSPDGQEFVVRISVGTDEELAIYDDKGTIKRQLTKNSSNERFPRWSPDGSKVYFHSDQGGKYQIWSIDGDGTNLRQITFSQKTGAVDAVLSPDGTKMIFSELDNSKQTPYLLDLTKTWQEQIPQPLLKDRFPAANITARNWSKEENRILVNFDKESSGSYEIGVIDLDDLRYEKIADFGFLPVWLNDSRRFIFADDDSIRLADADTKSVVELFKPPRYTVLQANLSRDNKLIFYRYLQLDSDIWLLDAS